MAEHPHRRAIAAGLAALVLGLVVALIVAGGDDDAPPGEEARQTTAPTEPQTETQTETAPTPRETETTPTRPPRRDLAAIQQVVALLIESAEIRDGAGVCHALGQPQGSGPEAAEACADRAGIDLSQLPGSDELSFERVRASGDRGRVVLGSGDSVSLRRQGDSWVVTDIRS
ncbi:MAG TPA: hypothetical protein VHG69_11030 [Thermoleophilaceae bacterium]|nr:hypothetical protein [Thermoleophilaceae bacterium]